MHGLPIEHAMALPAILFALGLIGLIIRRNMLFLLMCLEIMLNAAGLAFIVAGQSLGQPDGQIMFILTIALAGAEASIGLGLLLQLHRQYKTVDIDAASEMNG